MKRLFFLAVFFAFLCACNTSDDTQSQLPEPENFYALTVGNWWVYKNYKYNSNTQAYDYTSVVDSVSIIGTESINGNTYYNFRRNTTGNEANIAFCNENGVHFELLRDSLGYLVRSDGNIKFTNNDYNERITNVNAIITFYETLRYEMIDQTVEAGTFECLNMERYARNSNNVQLPGTNMNLYSNGKGLIYDTSSYVTQNIPTIIRRLDAYVVQ